MPRWMPQVLTVAVIAAIFAGNTLLPESFFARGLWLAGGLLAAALVYGAVWTAIVWCRLRRVEERAATAQTRCPSCRGAEHDYKSQGLWDGAPDLITGHRPGGTFGYGVCKGCGSRWGQWDGAPPYVPSEEEWEREVGRREALRAEQLRQWTEHHPRRTARPAGAASAAAVRRRLDLTRDDLVGTWQHGPSVYDLRPDGTAVITTEGESEAGTWLWVDATHWKLRTTIPPDPNIPGLEDGAINIEEFEVVEASPTHFRARVFDDESDFLFTRVRT